MVRKILQNFRLALNITLLKINIMSENKIIAGENSTPGVISLIAICNDEKIKNKVNLNSNSKVLLIGCEGDTDEEMYQKLLEK